MQEAMWTNRVQRLRMTWLGAGKIFRGFKAPKKSKATQGRQEKNISDVAKH